MGKIIESDRKIFIKILRPKMEHPLGYRPNNELKNVDHIDMFTK
jgi:hypothetical protein